MPETVELPAALAEATEGQPAVRIGLGAALAAGPVHSYLLRGPRGSGKSDAARAFAAELLATGAPDPDSARRRALAEPSMHPDLVWLRPPGAWHLVEEIRSQVIRASSLRPLEGERRVFVIEQAEAMRDESQNALLKTLEEPASFAHLVLICSEPEALLPTIASRCASVEFAPLAPEAIAARAGETGADPAELDAVSRLCGGDLTLARLLLSQPGRELRARAEAAARAVRAEEPPPEPWRPLLEAAKAAGTEASEAAEEALRERGAEGRSGKLPREAGEQLRRVERRARTAGLDAGLGLCGIWFRDLAALAEGVPEAALNSDRLEQLRADAEGVSSITARHAVELVLDTRRRLRLNVGEELALDALWFRLEDAFSG